MKVLGNLSKGLIFIVSAPAGTGKNTLVDRLVSEFSCVEESISYTTRKPRKGEIPGKHYHFIEEKEFLEKKKRGEFLEEAKVFNHYYGTLKSDLENRQKEGKHLVLVIDTQGAMQIRKKMEVVTIFIAPPSLKELQQRLQERKTEAAEAISLRLSWAEKELQQSVHYDYHIINQDLEAAYVVLRSILIAEEHRVRQT